MKAARSRPPSIFSSVNIRHISGFVDGPALNGVEVIDRSERTVRSANGDQLLQGRLHVAGFVRRSALQDGRLAVPNPGEAEADGAHRLRHRLKTSGIPGLAAVDRHVHRLDAAAPAPG